MSEAVIDVVLHFDPVQIATEANRVGVKRSTIIAGQFAGATRKRIGQEKRLSAKMVSDDTPIGEEDGDMRLRDLFIPRQNSAERVENYTEWMMFSRKGGCPFSPQEINDLFGLYSTERGK